VLSDVGQLLQPGGGQLNSHFGRQGSLVFLTTSSESMEAM
jgi:hypothetical protein